MVPLCSEIETLSIQFKKLSLSHKGQFCCGHDGLVK